jgi:hypothetical protein
MKRDEFFRNNSKDLAQGEEEGLAPLFLTCCERSDLKRTT